MVSLIFPHHPQLRADISLARLCGKKGSCAIDSMRKSCSDSLREKGAQAHERVRARALTSLGPPATGVLGGGPLSSLVDQNGGTVFPQPTWTKPFRVRRVPREPRLPIGRAGQSHDLLQLPTHPGAGDWSKLLSQPPPSIPKGQWNIAYLAYRHHDGWPMRVMMCPHTRLSVNDSLFGKTKTCAQRGIEGP